MISFMLQEGILTIGTLSGIFTALLLNSLKNNIIDPLVEKVVPLHKIGETPEQFQEELEKSGKENLFGDGKKGLNFFNFGNQFGGLGKDKIKGKVFLRDFLTWLIKEIRMNKI